ncbi:uncharacterized protein G2W53_037018 [Senna tora]|uniref:Uncharacterized protein n=1 Tax=Senna tora TaxID=362788 RepID=A0A834W5B7_9FABA|nr:uncharacterized protein G2W53_037018 [Senna tora]
MGQEIEMDLNEKSSVGLSPNTVLPSHQHRSYAKKRYKNGKQIGRDEYLTLKGNFAEIKFARFRSSSCKSTLSRPNRLEGSTDIMRCSMYQSSEEARNIIKMGSMGGRKKIEISRCSDTSFSGSIVDSLCSSDDEGSQQRSSVTSRVSNLNSSCVSRSWVGMQPNTPDGFIEICINSDVRDKISTPTVSRDSINSKTRNDKDTVQVLRKPDAAESDCSSRASPSVQFTPFRKRFNPFTKSKSLRSPVSSHMLETMEIKSTGKANISRNRSYQKSLLNDFSNAAKHSDIISEFIDRDIQHSGIACSPIHLHGNLKLEYKHGVPFFEFKLKCPEDVFVAKTWRVGNSFNWVYTFHSVDSRKKGNAIGLGSPHYDKDSSMVALMLVSCNLCSEMKGGVFDNSMVTEFVLYDLAHSRPSVSSQMNSSCDQDNSKTPKASHGELGREALKPDDKTLALKNKLQKLLSGTVDFDKPNFYHWLSTELHPSLEIAAIVLQIPFHKRESLKYKRGNRISAKGYSNLRDLSVVDQSRKSMHECRTQEQLKVVVPTGNHGLPNEESEGPLSLLERWRRGGGCDCGGWDMACPLVLLGNPNIQFIEDCPFMENSSPLELYVQGAKESTPTFSLRIVEEGQYAVDFHAQLSTLQAFSICVAILHGTSTFSGTGHQQQKQPQVLSQCNNSLKMLIEEEVDFLDSVPTKEKAVSKTPRGTTPLSYVLNPPFSPIARV